ncbi:MAG: hypothetical protein SRB2_03090 [Desulfobacteraceae bacterium Eth-SRB2]|nr:MAG: hypothetical protein SRB2_03090 [Desulfobacteraceae bacterium Eth-SRB2]
MDDEDDNPAWKRTEFEEMLTDLRKQNEIATIISEKPKPEDAVAQRQV